MKVIILDFSDWKLKIIDNLDEDLQLEEAEKLMNEEYRINLDDVEYMIVNDLKIETLN